MTAKRKPMPSAEKLGYTVEEAAEATTLGLSTLYTAIRRKRLVAHKYGTRTIITRDDLMAFLKGLKEKP